MSIVASPGPRASIHRHLCPSDLVHLVEVNASQRGTLTSIDPDDLTSICLDSLFPVRTKRSHVGAPNFSGKHFHAVLRRHVWFESRLEQQFLESTEADTSIVAIVSQPMRLHWVDAALRTHVPDYFVQHDDGRRRIINVRPADRVADSEHVFAQVDQFAESIGVEAEVFTGLAAARREELAFLHRYRLADRPSRPDLAEAMTVRWAYEQNDPGLVSDMWSAVANGALVASKGGLLRDDCLLLPSETER